jgi:hypothetical protein
LKFTSRVWKRENGGMKSTGERIIHP